MPQFKETVVFPYNKDINCHPGVRVEVYTYKGHPYLGVHLDENQDTKNKSYGFAIAIDAARLLVSTLYGAIEEAEKPSQTNESTFGPGDLVSHPDHRGEYGDVSDVAAGCLVWCTPGPGRVMIATSPGGGLIDVMASDLTMIKAGYRPKEWFDR